MLCGQGIDTGRVERDHMTNRVETGRSRMTNRIG